TAQDDDFAAGRLHDAAQNLKHRAFAGSVRSDQTKDLTVKNGEVDTAYRLHGTVILPETGHLDDGFASLDSGARVRAAGESCRHWILFSVGQRSPETRISPSADMPGLANPRAPLSCSFTPTTCFTRSSRK